MPKSVGGQGLSTTEVGSFMYELAKYDAGMATFYLLHNSLG
jgi:alkylation response protein AidB-like acyl-CoA dehydrogenase